MANVTTRVPMRTPHDFNRSVVQVCSDALKGADENLQAPTWDGDIHPSEIKTLLAAFKQGEHASFQRLYEYTEKEMADHIAFLCYKYNVRDSNAREDFLQDAFLAAFKNSKTFKGNNIISFTAWLKAIAKNEILGSFRKRQVQTCSIDLAQESAYEQWDGRKFPVSIAAEIAFAKLPAQLAKLMHLLVVREPPMSDEEAARELNIEVKSVLELRSRARKIIREDVELGDLFRR